jgi:hypothetical protein
MEFVLGLWLLLSPFVLHHEPTRRLLWIHDFAVGTLVVVLSLACHARALRRAHLWLLAVAVWLMGMGWWQGWQADTIHVDAAYQNWLLVGLLLAMLDIVPSDSSRPPMPWRRAIEGHARSTREGRPGAD